MIGSQNLAASIRRKAPSCDLRLALPPLHGDPLTGNFTLFSPKNGKKYQDSERAVQLQDLLQQRQQPPQEFQQRHVPYQQQYQDHTNQPYRHDVGHDDDGFPDEAGCDQKKVLRRKVPPFPESMGSQLASHTTHEEYDAYNMV